MIKFLKNNMFEFTLVFYLFSGILKDVLISLRIDQTVDITLISGIFLIIISLFKTSRNRINKSNLNNEKNKIIPLLLLFSLIAWSLISTFWGSNSIHFPIKKVFYFLTILIPPLTIYINNKFNLVLFSKYFISFSFLLFLYYFITSPNLMYYYDNGEMFLDYSGMKSFGLTTSIKAGVAIFLSLYFIKNIYLKSSLITLFTFLAFYTAARGSFIIAGVILIFFLIFKKQIVINKYNEYIKPYIKNILILQSIIILLLLGLINNDKYKEKTLNRAFFRYSVWFENSDEKVDEIEQIGVSEEETSLYEKIARLEKSNNKSTLARKLHYEFSFNSITSSWSSFLFGIGFGNYGDSCCNADKLEHPHNSIIEIIVETGIIGLSIFIWFLYLVYIKIKTNKSLVVISICTVFYFINMMKSWSIIEMKDFFAFAGILLFYQTSTNQINISENKVK